MANHDADAVLTGQGKKLPAAWITHIRKRIGAVQLQAGRRQETNLAMQRDEARSFLHQATGLLAAGNPKDPDEIKDAMGNSGDDPVVRAIWDEYQTLAQNTTRLQSLSHAGPVKLSEVLSEETAKAGKEPTKAQAMLVQVLEGRKKAAVDGLKKDGMAYIQSTGFLQPVPVRWADTNSIRMRVVQARQASEQFGVSIGFLTQAETRELQEQILAAEPAPGLALLENIARAHGDSEASEAAYETFAAQVAGRNPRLGQAIRAARWDPELAGDLMTGCMDLALALRVWNVLSFPCDRNFFKHRSAGEA